MGLDAMICFWMLSFKPTCPLFSFSFIKKLFSSSSLSAIRLVSSVYLRLLIFLLAVLIPACASSSSAFHMMYSAYKVNKQGDNIPPWCTPFPIWNQSVVPCPALTVASWPVYRFLRRQVGQSGIFISWIIFHSLLWSTKSKVWRNQESRSRCFLGILLLFWWSSGCWQLDLCPLSFLNPNWTSGSSWFPVC